MLQSLLPALSTLPWNWLQIPLPWTRATPPETGAHVSVITGAGIGLSATRLPLLAAIAIAYAAVITYFAARFLWRCRALRAMKREATKVALTGNAATCWSQCSQWFGIHADIAASSRIIGPVTLGFSRKLVLLPTSMVSGLNDADIHTVIAHEFAHMSRNDFLKNLLYELLSLPVSYHPLAWLTRERVTETREILCDQMAAEIGGRTQYAQSLLRLASLLVKGVPATSPHAIGIFDTQTFERRLMKLTEKQSQLPALRRFAIVIGCIAFGFATCGSAFALSLHVNAASSATANNPSSKTAPLTVPAHVMAGNRISGTDPTYPAAAKKDKVQGTVVLNAVIDKQGNIEKLTVVSGPNELRKSATDAVRTWKYKPFLLNGNPVEVQTTINVVYTLAG